MRRVFLPNDDESKTETKDTLFFLMFMFMSVRVCNNGVSVFRDCHKRAKVCSSLQACSIDSDNATATKKIIFLGLVKCSVNRKQNLIKNLWYEENQDVCQCSFQCQFIPSTVTRVE